MCSLFVNHCLGDLIQFHGFTFQFLFISFFLLLLPILPLPFLYFCITTIITIWSIFLSNYQQLGPYLRCSKLLCWEKNVGSMISGRSWEISHVTIAVIIASEREMVMFWIHFIRCSQEDGLDVNDQEKCQGWHQFLSRTTGKMELLLTDVSTVIGACFVYVIRWWLGQGLRSSLLCSLRWILAIQVFMLIRQFGQARLSHEIMNSIVYFLCLCCDCDSTLHIVSKQIFKLNIRHFSRFFFFFFFYYFSSHF